MTKFRILLILFIAGICLSIYAAETKSQSTTPQWSMNATAIEACSCPMFCQCYFNSKPGAHHEHGQGETHYCRANLAYKVNRGNYGSVKLDGAKFWISSDLGADFSKGQMDWAVVTFDKPLSKEQRDGIATIVGHLFPVKWNSLTTAEATIDRWEFNKDSAYASMDGGKTAEVKLKRFAGNSDDPVVIRNLKYWGAPRNDGFVLMPNEVEAYRIGPKAFEFKGTNGFMITVDINSNDVGKVSM
ncbi:DUF1326 domain-containing protein [bacterium]|nr:DUF1326 domain-containing protein [bacterium]MCI0613243.1 DUF1326 domain-containing protein [bacterium]